ncbi:MAG TPA: hypothetical protein VMU84_02150 [Thermoanaerobaculia bacterium]|nr:hypothetical protein [Thermoanaerobaculia bacterium]
MSKRRLLEGDPILSPLYATHDPAKREAIIARLLTEVAEPVIRRSLGRRNMLRDEDVDDIRGAVMIRLLRKFESIFEAEPIASFADYVATVTFHAVDDHLRQRQPQRTLLANRIRYVLTRDARFAIWERDRDLVCGFAAWRERPTRAVDADVSLDPRRIAASLERLFAASGGALGFHAVVSLFAASANLDARATTLDEVDLRDNAAAALDRLQAKEILEKLWREILELPPRQRVALLLNLRDVQVLADLAALAVAVDIPASELAALWPELPLDDQWIAARLGATRQQVINLRKCARERLARRMARW